MDFNDVESYYKPTYFSTTLEGENGQQIIYDFRQKLIHFLKNKNRSYKLIEMPFETDKHFINIGSYNGNWLATTSHKTINMDYLALFFLKDIIDEDLESISPDLKSKLLQKYQYQFDLNINEFLVLFIGPEFLLSDLFDPIRQVILNLFYY